MPHRTAVRQTSCFASMGNERFPPLQSDREKQEVMFRLRRHDWITLTAFIVAGVVVGYVVYNKWARPRFEEGLRRTEADMKSNLPLRVDQNTTLVDVKYKRTYSAYWYVVDKPTNLTLKRQRDRFKSEFVQTRQFEHDEKRGLQL